MHTYGRPRGRFRGLVAFLLAAGCLTTPLAIAAVWLRAEVLDTHAYVKTVAPLSSNPAVRAAVTDEITNALFAHVGAAAAQSAAAPLGVSLQDYTRTAVDRFLRTARFQRIWVVANTQAHEALVAKLEGKPSPFIAPDGSIDLDLSDAVTAARQELADAGLHLFDNVDPAPRLVVARPGSLDRLRHGVRILKALSVALPALTVALFGLAFVISSERRRTLLRAGLGLAATSALAIAAIVGLRSLYLRDIVGANISRDAARAIYDVVVSSLRFELEIACASGLAVFAAAVVAGSALFVVRRARDPRPAHR